MRFATSDIIRKALDRRSLRMGQANIDALAKMGLSMRAVNALLDCMEWELALGKGPDEPAEAPDPAHRKKPPTEGEPSDGEEEDDIKKSLRSPLADAAARKAREWASAGEPPLRKGARPPHADWAAAGAGSRAGDARDALTGHSSRALAKAAEVDIARKHQGDVATAARRKAKEWAGE